MVLSRSEDARLAYWQRRVFAVGWVTYASYYLTRLNFSAALPGIVEEFRYSKLALGLIGSGFSVVYAFGQVANGWLAGRMGSRRLVTLGLLASSLINLLFGFTDLLAAMMVLWALNGYFQSMGWTPMVKALAEWFPISRRGRITGLFSSCFLVGSVFSWLLAGFLAGNLGWRTAFWLPSVAVLFFAFLFGMGVRDAPEDVGLTLSQRENPRPAPKSPGGTSLRKTGVIAAAYTFNSFVRSGLTLWAPSYVLETLLTPLDKAVYGASVIPLGGVLGAYAAGWASDRLFRSRRAPVAALMTAGLGLLLPAFYIVRSAGWMTSLLLLATAGFLLYGPQSLMATTMPIDYASKRGAALMAGIIDGAGYLGLAFADPFTGWLVDMNGWDAAVSFWIASSFASTALTLPLWRDQPVEHGR